MRKTLENTWYVKIKKLNVEIQSWQLMIRLERKNYNDKITD